jgi:hypothetical protein
VHFNFDYAYDENGIMIVISFPSSFFFFKFKTKKKTTIRIYLIFHKYFILNVIVFPQWVISKLNLKHLDFCQCKSDPSIYPHCTFCIVTMSLAIILNSHHLHALRFTEIFLMLSMKELIFLQSNFVIEEQNTDTLHPPPKYRLGYYIRDATIQCLFDSIFDSLNSMIFDSIQIYNCKNQILYHLRFYMFHCICCSL